SCRVPGPAKERIDKDGPAGVVLHDARYAEPSARNRAAGTFTRMPPPSAFGSDRYADLNAVGVMLRPPIRVRAGMADSGQYPPSELLARLRHGRNWFGLRNHAWILAGDADWRDAAGGRRRSTLGPPRLSRGCIRRRDRPTPPGGEGRLRGQSGDRPRHAALCSTGGSTRRLPDELV